MNDLKIILENFIIDLNHYWNLAGIYFVKALIIILLIIIAYFLAELLKNSAKKIAKNIKLDDFLKKVEFDIFLDNIDYRLNSGRFLGELVKWFVYLTFFILILNILNLSLVLGFIKILLLYLLKIFMAILIFVISVFVARLVRKSAIAFSKILRIKNNKILAEVFAYTVYFLAILAILDIFGITDNILAYIGIIIQGAVLGLALAFGLAFGLGGKEKAKEFLDRWKK